MDLQYTCTLILHGTNVRSYRLSHTPLGLRRLPCQLHVFRSFACSLYQPFILRHMLFTDSTNQTLAILYLGKPFDAVVYHPNFDRMPVSLTRQSLACSCPAGQFIPTIGNVWYVYLLFAGLCGMSEEA